VFTNQVTHPDPWPIWWLIWPIHDPLTDRQLQAWLDAHQHSDTDRDELLHVTEMTSETTRWWWWWWWWWQRQIYQFDFGELFEVNLMLEYQRVTSRPPALRSVQITLDNIIIIIIIIIIMITTTTTTTTTIIIIIINQLPAVYRQYQAAEFSFPWTDSVNSLSAVLLDNSLALSFINPSMGTGNYSATSNNMKLVHWQLIGGLLHLVQWGGAAARPGPSSLYQM